MKKILVTVALFLVMVQLLAAPPHEFPKKIEFCSRCHGQQGTTPHANWPNLAGQHSLYLRKQLDHYEKRHAEVRGLTPIHLSHDDKIQLSTYYSNLPLLIGETPKKYLKHGEHLYRIGDFEKRVTACIACHGPRGRGNAQAGFPVLAGQNALYTIQQLHAFQKKTRATDLSGVMSHVSAFMDQEDMVAVAYYLQGLP